MLSLPARAGGRTFNLFVVADGMGGHQCGRFFALSDRAYAEYQRVVENEPVAALRIEAVNQKLYTFSCILKELAGMGTTLVAASIQEIHSMWQTGTAVSTD